MPKEQSLESHKRGVPSKRAITLKYLGHAEEALEVLVETMRNKRAQDTARLAAARAILDKVIPDVRAMEIMGEDHGPIRVIIVADDDEYRARVANQKLPEATVDI